MGAWGGHSNGQIPESALVSVGNGQFAQKDAAAAWFALQAACYAATGVMLGVNEAYRNLAGQQYYWNRYINKLPGWTVAAYPGTSNHGWAIAFDITGYDAAWTWLQNNAARFGFSWATGKASNERWHWEFVGALGSYTSIINARLDSNYIKALQAQLGVGVDGDAGPETTKALQTRIGTVADGDFGPNSIKALQIFIGAVPDGDWGTITTGKTKEFIDEKRFGIIQEGAGWESLTEAERKSLQTQLGVDDDGIIGPQTISALQTKIGTPADGVFGPASTEALQSFIGANVDGVWGSETTSKMKAAIAANKFAGSNPPPEPPTTSLPAGYEFGCDVAYIQTAAFNWQTYKANHDFIIIKAGGAEDPPLPGQIYGPAGLTDQHLAGARSVGLRVGFYWFNNANVNIKAQADKFTEVMKTRIKPGDFIALDIEHDQGGKVPQFNVAQALEFANYMELALGIKTLMYMNRSTMKNEDWSPIVDQGHPLWMAVLNQTLESGIAAMKEVKWWTEAAVVQYASTLGTPGYAAMNIDTNFGKVSVLESIGFVAYPVPPTPEPEPEPEPQPGIDLEKLKRLAQESRDAAVRVNNYAKKFN